MNAMKSISFIILLSFAFIACTNTKKTTQMPDISTLNGTWELNYITGPRIAFDGLYPGKKPFINFDIAQNRVNGNTSCNSFNGPLKVDGHKIDFNSPMALTKMACIDGNGENVFLETLKKVNAWSITDGNTLHLMMGDIAMMRFVKK